MNIALLPTLAVAANPIERLANPPMSAIADRQVDHSNLVNIQIW